jgi:gliding motility-associated-like protein
MLTKRLYIVFFIFLTFPVNAQNLVINGSFENNYVTDFPYPFCDSVAISLNVNNPNEGNPTYCHIRSCFMQGAPLNQFGYQWPYDGNAYYLVGVYSGEDTSMTYLFREYLTLEIKEPLTENKCYFVSFFLSLTDTFACAIDEMSALFTDTLIYYGTNGVIPLAPQINNPPGRFLSDNKGWMEVNGYYTAHGGENYITIGNFKDDIHTDSIMVHGPSHYPGGIIGNHQAAGYYIDMVSVIECPDTVETPLVYLPNVFSPNNDGYNDVFYLRGESISQMDLKIYNRWGELVFESNDLSIGWDGKYKGKEYAEGVYFYVAEVTFANGEVQEKKGSITLIR